MENSTTVLQTPKEKVSFFVDQDTITKLRVYCAIKRLRPGVLLAQIIDKFVEDNKA